jgi:hypothetical protein
MSLGLIAALILITLSTDLCFRRCAALIDDDGLPRSHLLKRQVTRQECSIFPTGAGFFSSERRAPVPNAQERPMKCAHLHGSPLALPDGREI